MESRHVVHIGMRDNEAKNVGIFSNMDIVIGEGIRQFFFLLLKELLLQETQGFPSRFGELIAGRAPVILEYLCSRLGIENAEVVDINDSNAT
jgi:hypothetical protein